MKISYKFVSGGAYLVLFDETAGGAMTPEFAPKFKPLNQATPRYGADAVYRAPLGNTVVTLALMFNVEYSSRQASLASIRTFAALRGQLVHLMVQQDTETQYYPNALVEDYEAKLSGVSADHSFVFNSDAVTGVAP
jgi:hypothetical protein